MEHPINTNMVLNTTMVLPKTQHKTIPAVIKAYDIDNYFNITERRCMQL